MKYLVILLSVLLLNCNGEEPNDSLPHDETKTPTNENKQNNDQDQTEEEEEKVVLDCPGTQGIKVHYSWRDDYNIFGREDSHGDLDGYIIEFNNHYSIWELRDPEGHVVACGNFGVTTNVGSWQGGLHNRWSMPMSIVTESGTQNVTCSVFSFEDGANIVPAEPQPVPAGESEFYMACPNELYDTDISYHFRSYGF